MARRGKGLVKDFDERTRAATVTDDIAVLERAEQDRHDARACCRGQCWHVRAVAHREAVQAIPPALTGPHRGIEVRLPLCLPYCHGGCTRHQPRRIGEVASLERAEYIIHGVQEIDAGGFDKIWRSCAGAGVANQALRLSRAVAGDKEAALSNGNGVEEIGNAERLEETDILQQFPRDGMRQAHHERG